MGGAPSAFAAIASAFAAPIPRNSERTPCTLQTKLLPGTSASVAESFTTTSAYATQTRLLSAATQYSLIGPGTPMLLRRAYCR